MEKEKTIYSKTITLLHEPCCDVCFFTCMVYFCFCLLGHINKKNVYSFKKRYPLLYCHPKETPPLPRLHSFINNKNQCNIQAVSKLNVLFKKGIPKEDKSIYLNTEVTNVNV